MAFALLFTNTPRSSQLRPVTTERCLSSYAPLNEQEDIAALNLSSAEGLPGAENLHRNQCLATINQWAEHVRSETARHLYRFRSNPGEFEHSEAYFRMLMMAVTLYEDFGIRYNPDRIGSNFGDLERDKFFSDSRDLFLHGLCGPRRTGTCSSMPVLYAAIGRRLGYPLKLVTTKSHLFLRWEGRGERFNLEATGRGMNRYDDDHFKNWPFPVTDEEAAANGFLKSLSPSEELALFLSLRGHCLRQAQRIKEAAEAYAAATRLAPASRGYALLLADAQRAAPQPTAPVSSTAAYSVAPQAPPSTAPHDPNPLSQIRHTQNSTTKLP